MSGDGHEEAFLEALRAHVGRWVAVLGTEVIAAGNSPLEVIGFLRGQGLHADSVFRIPEDPRSETEREA